jgi:hypothetical protein
MHVHPLLLLGRAQSDKQKVWSGSRNLLEDRLVRPVLQRQQGGGTDLYRRERGVRFVQLSSGRSSHPWDAAQEEHAILPSSREGGQGQHQIGSRDTVSRTAQETRQPDQRHAVRDDEIG